jgi:uncharacterized protein DUF1569
VVRQFGEFSTVAILPAEALRMKNFFDGGRADELKGRLMKLQPDSQRQWGTMTVAQAVAHLSVAVEMGLGDVRPPRAMIGRILGAIVKPLALGNDKPFRRNSPTARELVIKDDRELNAERARLNGLIDRLVVAGPTGFTSYPHAFFGALTPEQWGILMYKHLDHHLRQFGV